MKYFGFTDFRHCHWLYYSLLLLGQASFWQLLIYFCLSTTARCLKSKPQAYTSVSLRSLDATSFSPATCSSLSLMQLLTMVLSSALLELGALDWEVISLLVHYLWDCFEFTAYSAILGKWEIDDGQMVFVHCSFLHCGSWCFTIACVVSDWCVYCQRCWNTPSNSLTTILMQLYNTVIVNTFRFGLQYSLHKWEYWYLWWFFLPLKLEKSGKKILRTPKKWIYTYSQTWYSFVLLYHSGGCEIC